jgi:hypothetical protein
MWSSGRFRFGEGAGVAALMAISIELFLEVELTVGFGGVFEEYIFVAARRLPLSLIRSAMVGTKFSLLLGSTTADAAVETVGIVLLFGDIECRLVEAGVKPGVLIHIRSCALVAIADAARFVRSRGCGMLITCSSHDR